MRHEHILSLRGQKVPADENVYESVADTPLQYDYVTPQEAVTGHSSVKKLSNTSDYNPNSEKCQLEKEAGEPPVVGDAINPVYGTDNHKDKMVDNPMYGQTGV